MSLDLPPLNCRYVATQAPDITNQEDSKSEQSDRVDNKENEQEDQLRGSRAKILRGSDK